MKRGGTSLADLRWLWVNGLFAHFGVATPACPTKIVNEWAQEAERKSIPAYHFTLPEEVHALEKVRAQCFSLCIGVLLLACELFAPTLNAPTLISGFVLGYYE